LGNRLGRGHAARKQCRQQGDENVWTTPHVNDRCQYLTKGLPGQINSGSMRRHSWNGRIPDRKRTGRAGLK